MREQFTGTKIKMYLLSFNWSESRIEILKFSRFCKSENNKLQFNGRIELWQNKTRVTEVNYRRKCQQQTRKGKYARVHIRHSYIMSRLRGLYYNASDKRATIYKLRIFYQSHRILSVNIFWFDTLSTWIQLTKLLVFSGDIKKSGSSTWIKYRVLRFHGVSSIWTSIWSYVQNTMMFAKSCFDWLHKRTLRCGPNGFTR